MIAFGSGTLKEFFWAVYRPCRLLGCAETTTRRYGVVLRHLERYLGRPPLMGDLVDQTLAQFLGWYSETGVCGVTVNTVRAHLMALARFAQSKGIIESVPEVARVPERRPVPRAWTHQQFAQLVGFVRGCPGEVAGIPARLFWEALFRLLYDTGLRCGAMFQVRQDDIDLGRAAILVRPETQKQRAGQYVLFSPQTTLPVVRAIWLPERELLFPWPMDRSLIWQRLDRLLIAAGLPHDRRSKFHRIRRTHASYLKAAGGDPTESLGHSSPAVTKSYLDPAICGTQRAVDLLPVIEP